MYDFMYLHKNLGTTNRKKVWYCLSAKDLIHLICLSPAALRQVLTGEFLFPACCSFVHLAKLKECVDTKTEHQIFTHDLKQGSAASLNKQLKVFEL